MEDQPSYNINWFYLIQRRLREIFTADISVEEKIKEISSILTDLNFKTHAFLRNGLVNCCKNMTKILITVLTRNLYLFRLLFDKYESEVKGLNNQLCKLLALYTELQLIHNTITSPKPNIDACIYNMYIIVLQNYEDLIPRILIDVKSNAGIVELMSIFQTYYSQHRKNYVTDEEYILNILALRKWNCLSLTNVENVCYAAKRFMKPRPTFRANKKYSSLIPNIEKVPDEELTEFLIKTPDFPHYDKLIKLCIFDYASDIETVEILDDDDEEESNNNNATTSTNVKDEVRLHLVDLDSDVPQVDDYLLSIYDTIEVHSVTVPAYNMRNLETGIEIINLDDDDDDEVVNANNSNESEVNENIINDNNQNDQSLLESNEKESNVEQKNEPTNKLLLENAENEVIESPSENVIPENLLSDSVNISTENMITDTSININESSDMLPTEENRETSIANNTTESVDGDNATEPISGRDSLSALADKGSASIMVNKGITSVMTDKDSTSVLAEKGSTSVLMDKGSTSVLTDKGSTSVLTDKGSTSVLTDKGSTSVLADKASTSASIGKDSSTKSINENCTLISRNSATESTNESSAIELIKKDTTILAKKINTPTVAEKSSTINRDNATESCGVNSAIEVMSKDTTVSVLNNQEKRDQDLTNQTSNNEIVTNLLNTELETVDDTNNFTGNEDTSVLLNNELSENMQIDTNNQTVRDEQPNLSLTRKEEPVLPTVQTDKVIYSTPTIHHKRLRNWFDPLLNSPVDEDNDTSSSPVHSRTLDISANNNLGGIFEQTSETEILDSSAASNLQKRKCVSFANLSGRKSPSINLINLDHLNSDERTYISPSPAQQYFRHTPPQSTKLLSNQNNSTSFNQINNQHLSSSINNRQTSSTIISSPLTSATTSVPAIASGSKDSAINTQARSINTYGSTIYAPELNINSNSNNNNNSSSISNNNNFMNINIFSNNNNKSSNIKNTNSNRKKGRGKSKSTNRASKSDFDKYIEQLKKRKSMHVNNKKTDKQKSINYDKKLRAKCVVKIARINLKKLNLKRKMKTNQTNKNSTTKKVNNLIQTPSNSSSLTSNPNLNLNNLNNKNLPTSSDVDNGLVNDEHLNSTNVSEILLLQVFNKPQKAIYKIMNTENSRMKLKRVDNETDGIQTDKNLTETEEEVADVLRYKNSISQTHIDNNINNQNNNNNNIVFDNDTNVSSSSILPYSVAEDESTCPELGTKRKITRSPSETKSKRLKITSDQNEDTSPPPPPPLPIIKKRRGRKRKNTQNIEANNELPENQTNGNNSDETIPAGPSNSGNIADSNNTSVNNTLNENEVTSTQDTNSITNSVNRKLRNRPRNKVSGFNNSNNNNNNSSSINDGADGINLPTTTTSEINDNPYNNNDNVTQKRNTRGRNRRKSPRSKNQSSASSSSTNSSILFPSSSAPLNNRKTYSNFSSLKKIYVPIEVESNFESDVTTSTVISRKDRDTTS